MMIDGSYLVSSKYVQTSISMNSFYLDSVITTASAFLKNNLQTSLSNVSGSVSDFMFSGDAYFSTDFSSLSFNIPYVLLANTKKDNQFLMLSFDGNEQSVTLSQADLIFGKQAFRASASFDRMSESNYFFSLDLNSESIPYHFAGTFTDGLMRVSGDYDTEFEINFEDLNDFSGYVQSVNFPVSLFGTSIVSSLAADFHYSPEKGPELNLLKFEMEEAGDKISFKPHISVSGNATKYGAQFNSITYSDLYSVLDGTADITLNLFEDIFNSCNVSVNLQNPLSDESIHIGANISNPDNAEFSLSSLLKNYYFDSTILVNKVSMNRFTILNSANNELTASVFFTGTIEHPYVSVGVEKANVMISGNALSASASILMEDRDISINDVDVVYRGIKINNVSGFFSLDSFAGELDANLDGILMQESIHVPIFLNVTDAVKEEGKFFPSSFTATIGTEGAYGSLMKKDAAFSISAFYAPSMISVISSENIGLFGFYNKSGSFAFQLDSKDTARLNLTGELNPENMEMKDNISDVFFDMEKLCSYINFHNFVEVYSGVLSGDLTFSGTIDSPIFGGEMVLDNPNITLPTVLNDHVFTDTILLTFSEGEINIHEKRFKIKTNNEVVAGAKIFTDKWKLEHIEAEIRTENDNVIPVKIKNPEIEITGNADGQISLYYVPHDIEITGKIFAEKAEVYLKLSKLVTMAENKVAPNTYVNCNLDVSLGTHVRLNADPLIRCIFVPNGSLKVQYDQRSEQIALEGLLGLKSGDVSYLNRNFYIKEGSIRFAQSDEQLNPRITVRAETRERDSNGDNVTIILNAINQEMLSFTPTFSSIPAKSDNEIRTLLGQIVLADSETVGNFLFAAGDYAIQSVLFRKLENSLRDFLNFDILSVRTNIIQNTLSYTTSTKSKDSFNVGNFLDNSTVYIGKYLGSSFYVDAMVHLQFDERNAIENGKWINNYSLQPEVGFEFVSPFTNVIGNEDVLWNFNCLLNIAPDINAMIQSQQFVPATTLSFSWKFSF